MRTNFTVSLAKIISEFSLETLNMPANPDKPPGLAYGGVF